MLKRKTAILVGCLLAGGVLGGCQQALFPKDMPRSPYERYLTLRGQHRPATEPDAYGVQRPNLRDRLRPLGQE